MGPPVILAIETSQRCGGVALMDGAGVVHIESLRSDLRHDDDLLAAIDRLVGRLSMGPRDLDAVAVSVGPGGFTGLRIAVSTAKMLGEALEIPLVAVPSALVVAERCPVTEGPIMVALACKDQMIWLTRLARSAEGFWIIQGEPGPTEAGRIDPSATAALLADRYLPDPARVRFERAGVPILEPTFDPGGCVAISARWLAAGLTTDPLALAPIYARPPQAVVQWNRRNGPPDGSDNR